MNKYIPTNENNLDETDKFLERYTLLKPTQEETEDLNRPIRSKGIELIIQKTPVKKNPRPDGFTDTLLPESCCNKLPQTWGLKTEMYSLTVLEARNLKSGCWLGHASL